MALIGYLSALLASFYVIGRVVDEYFVESLDKLANKLKMSSDAAGATLMAVGSSAPELFVALFAVFYPSGDHAAIGVGNIVGSALFNLLGITGATLVVRKAVLAWQPVMRDMTFYAIAVVLLIFVFHDGSVDLLDAGLLLGIYVIYVFVVIYWRRIVKYNDPNEKIIEEEDNNEDADKPVSLYKKMTAPADWLIDLLFPPAKYYGWVFTISILMIAGLSWVLVESAVQVAHILDISEAIIAVTILAAGTSIPDLLSSVIVAKQGRGGMAVSNAVGSNIFDILVGLGLPFLIMILIKGGDLDMNVGNLENSVLFLLASIIAMVGIFIIARWKVGKLVGFLFIGLYIAYLGYAVISLN